MASASTVQTPDSDFDSLPFPFWSEKRRENSNMKAEEEKPFVDTIFHEPIPFKSSERNGFLSNYGVHVTITKVERTAESASQRHPHWSPYEYSIDVVHGPHKWTIKKRYHNFFKLHTAILFLHHEKSNLSPVGASEEECESSESNFKEGSKPNHPSCNGDKIETPQQQYKKKASLIQRLKSTTEKPGLRSARFPKKPDFMIPFDESVLERRKHQLEDYLNAILQCEDYRHYKETLVFFEVSEFSFTKDLIKSKEGMVKRRAGGFQNRKGLIAWLSRGLQCMFCHLVGYRWYRVWCSVQENCLILLNPVDGRINLVLLFDSGFQIVPDRRHSFWVKNFSRSLTIDAVSPQRQRDWIQSIVRATGKDTPGFDFIRRNRFGSFAPPRENSRAYHFVDGEEYMTSVAEAIEAATEEIYITDWWLSPEVYLRRGLEFDENLRFDRLLAKKAEEGVKIFILLYKEFSLALGLNSLYTKRTLSKNGKNIKVLRHPDRTGADVNDYLWAHHEKVIVIDQTLAFVGGLDMCYGRWDNVEHRLTDIDTVDTAKVGSPMPLVVPPPSTSSRPALPYQTGSHIMYGLKSAHEVTMAPVRAFNPAVNPATSVDELDGHAEEGGRGVKKRLKNAYRKAKKKLHRGGHSDTEDSDEYDSSDSSSSESSDEDAPTERIRAKVSSAAKKISRIRKSLRRQPSKMASAEAENEQQKLKVVNIMMEDTEDGLASNSGSTLWKAKDYVNFIVKDVARPDLPDQDNVDRRFTARMPWHDISVAVEGQAARDVARHFIQRWNAIKTEKAKYSKQYPFLVPKSYANLELEDALKRPPLLTSAASNMVNCQVLRSGSQWSMDSEITERSIYNAMVDIISKAERFVYIENQFFITNSSEKMAGNSNGAGASSADYQVQNAIGRALVEKVIEMHKKNQAFRVYILIPLLPAFEGEIGGDSGSALRTILHYNYASICRGPKSMFKQLEAEGINPSSYVSFCSVRNHGELLGTAVTELIYIHSKLLIVDDKYVICGSANINDRSLLGDRDSEVALLLEDTQFSRGNCGKFAGSLRKQLMAEHLGLTANSKLIEDCVSESFYKEIWLRRAALNTKLFEETFLCVPTDEVRTIEGNRKFLLKRPLAETDKFEARKKIQEIQGYLVLLPLNYLENENLQPSIYAKEGLVPTITWT